MAADQNTLLIDDALMLDQLLETGRLTVNKRDLLVQDKVCIVDALSV